VAVGVDHGAGGSLRGQAAGVKVLPGKMYV
jgi:hypothetical protein